MIFPFICSQPRVPEGKWCEYPCHITVIQLCPPTLLGFLSSWEFPIAVLNLFRKGLWSSRSPWPSTQRQCVEQSSTAQKRWKCLLPLHMQGSPLEWPVSLPWTVRDCCWTAVRETAHLSWLKKTQQNNLFVCVACKYLHKILNRHYNMAKPVPFVKANFLYQY